MLDLPAELIKQIVAEVLTEEELAMSSVEDAGLPHKVLPLLLTNKLLSQEASERIEYIAASGTVNLYISAAKLATEVYLMAPK